MKHDNEGKWEEVKRTMTRGNETEVETYDRIIKDTTTEHEQWNGNTYQAHRLTLKIKCCNYLFARIRYIEHSTKTNTRNTNAHWERTKEHTRFILKTQTIMNGKWKNIIMKDTQMAHKIEMLTEIDNMDNDIIYVIWAPQHQHTYIGETMKQLKMRFYQHMNNALKEKKQHKDVPTKCTKIMTEIGAYKWLIAPVQIITRTSRTNRLTYERNTIRRYQPDMNTTLQERFTKTQWVKERKTRNCRDNRRNKKQADRLQRINIQTKYRVSKGKLDTEKVPCISLNHMMDIKMKKKENTIWLHPMKHKSKQTMDTTNQKDLRDRYPKSTITIKNRTILLTEFVGQKTTRKWKGPAKITIIENTYEERITTKLTKMIKKPHTMKRTLKKATVQQILNMIAIIDNNQHMKPQTRVRILQKLRTQMKKNTGCNIKLETTARYPYNHNIDVKGIKHILKNEIIPQTQTTTDLKTYMTTQMKIIPTRRKNIQEMLVNQKHHIKDWNREETPKCCGLGCTEEKHYQMKMSDMEGDAGIIGRYNTKTIPVPTIRDDKRDILKIARDILKPIANLTSRKSTLRNSNWSNNTVDIHDKDGNVTYTIRRTQMEQLEQNCNNTNNFERELHETVKHYQKKNIALFNKGIHYKIVEFMKETFNVTMERRTNPLQYNRTFESFSTQREKDNIFGATHDEGEWTENAYIAYTIAETMLTQNIKDAIKATTTNVTSIMIIPLSESKTRTMKKTMPEYMHLLNHKNITIIAKWEENTFKNMSFVTNETYKGYNKRAQVMIAISKNPYEITREQKDRLTTISRQIFQTKPKFDEEITIEKNDPLTRSHVIEQMEKMKEQHKKKNKQKKEKIVKTTRTQDRKQTNTVERELEMTLKQLKIHNPKDVIQRLKEQTNNEEILTDKNAPTKEMINNVRNKYARMVITPMDKNDTMLYVECPVIYYQRMETEIMFNGNWQHITPQVENERNLLNKLKETIDEHYILETAEERKEQMQMKKHPTTRSLKHIKNITIWSERGEIPNTYANPKYKEPDNKQRLIQSYFKYPMKTLFQLTSKILTWMHRQLPSTTKHFTLQKLNDLRKKMQQINDTRKDLNKNNVKKTIATQTDVTQMYTFLNHNEIKAAMRWLTDIMMNVNENYTNQNGQQTRGKRYNERKYITINRRTKEITWGRENSQDAETNELVTFHIEDLHRVIQIDLDHAYSKVGGNFYQQMNGIPIGGLLGAIYANTFCSYRESMIEKYMKDNIHDHRTLTAIRQMDDLVFWIQHSDTKNGKEKAETMRQWIIDECYGDDLELKKQEIEMAETTNTFTHKFAGTNIVGNNNENHIKMTTFNKNWEEIQKTNQQKYRRYQTWESYTPKQYKIGTISTAMCRVKDTNTEQTDIPEAIMREMKEFEIIGYPKTIVKQTIEKKIKVLFNRHTQSMIRQMMRKH